MTPEDINELFTHTTLSYERNGKTYSIPAGNLNVNGVAYLLQYGFSQSLQDSIAGRAKAVAEEMLPPVADRKPDFVAPTADQIKTAIESDLDGQLNKRLDGIVAGSVATRGPGVARDPALGIIREFLVAHARKTGKKLPKADSDEYAAMVAKVREAKAEWIAAELTRRAEVDIDIEL